MACARCDFYTPKDSSKAQLLEASDNLQRMLASIPLTDWGAPSVPDCGPPVGFIWSNWSGPVEPVMFYQASSGSQGWPSASMTRASKKQVPCLAAVAR